MKSPCPLCAADTGRSRDICRGAERFRVAACARSACGVRFRVPAEENVSSARYDGPEYFASWGLGSGEVAAVRRLKRASAAHWLGLIARRKGSGRLLDIGCATGFFLEEARARGFDVYGLDISRWATDRAAETFGQGRIVTGTLPAAAYPDAAFDVVTAFDVIEHVPDPAAFLRECRRILAPAGVMAFVTPNPAGILARLMGSNWTHYKDEHLFYFSPRAFRNLCARVGLRVLESMPAAKRLTVNYVLHQLRAYPQGLLSVAARLALGLVPNRWRDEPWPVRIGEYFFLVGHSYAA